MKAGEEPIVVVSPKGKKGKYGGEGEEKKNSCPLFGKKKEKRRPVSWPMEIKNKTMKENRTREKKKKKGENKEIFYLREKKRCRHTGDPENGGEKVK